MVTRHLLDSLAVAPYLRGQDIIDVGTGAGLPGIPLAIWFPGRDFTAGQQRQEDPLPFSGKTALRLDNMLVHHARAESWMMRGVSTVSRAFASLADMVAGCRHLLAPGGCLLAMKGAYPTRRKCRGATPYTVVPDAACRSRHLLNNGTC